ncbi:MAG: hypothetical protein JST01_18605 [Cyanobacteria bacterium SZAS TMP-1]|nr:hypothetical protein [Cyanobacteria bacterium SZAS TMP-1]
MNVVHKSVFWSVLFGLVFAGLAYVLTSTTYNPFLKDTFPVYLGYAITAGTGLVAAGLFWLYHRWQHDWLKVRLFLAPLAGLSFACVAYYLTAPQSEHWTVYTFMNLVQPSAQVQIAFTMIGFAGGALLMLLMGAHFFQRRFFASFVVGLMAFFAAGYGISAALLPYLVTNHHSQMVDFVASYGLNAGVFFGAFVFFMVLLPGHLGGKKKDPPQ